MSPSVVGAVRSHVIFPFMVGGWSWAIFRSHSFSSAKTCPMTMDDFGHAARYAPTKTQQKTTGRLGLRYQHTVAEPEIRQASNAFHSLASRQLVFCHIYPDEIYLLLDLVFLENWGTVGKTLEM
jgi:hypothetical protein